MGKHNHEQWKAGDCEKCRKKNYCKKECRASRIYRERIIGDIVRKAAGIDRLKGSVGEIDE